MSNYDNLVKIIDREVISVKELRQITNDELVSQITKTKPDQKRKYYFKKPWHMILFGDKKEDIKQ